MNQQSIAELVYVLGEAFRQKVSEHTVRAYEIGLKGVSDDRIAECFARAIATCKFMPTVAELRELAGVVLAQDRAVLAWVAVKRAVHEVGEYRSVDFVDPLVNATVRVIGGWDRLCATECGEAFDTWKRKQFEETYRLLARSGVGDDLCQALPGVSESVRQPVRVAVGYDCGRRLLGDLSERTGAAQGAAVTCDAGEIHE